MQLLIAASDALLAAARVRNCVVPSDLDEAPEADAWLHELKFDGYRILCRLQDGKARLLSRNGKDWTEQFEVVE